MENINAIIVIPTYNERTNVEALIGEILRDIRADILVVDDNSPDQTAQIIRDLARRNPRVHLLFREKKEGLGAAYVAGFTWALTRNYTHIVQMDADFSHRVEDLRILLKHAQSHSAVIGSRWISGGAVKNWSAFRRFLSLSGNAYARAILRHPVYDWTGGFNVWHRDVLRAVAREEMESLGYVFQVELKLRALKLNFPLFEVPILFEERRLGRSKMSLAIIFEAWWRIWQLRRKSFPYSSESRSAS